MLFDVTTPYSHCMTLLVDENQSHMIKNMATRVKFSSPLKSSFLKVSWFPKATVYGVACQIVWGRCRNVHCINDLFSMLFDVTTPYNNENAGALARTPATCPLCQYSCPKVVKGSQDVMTSWRHMTSGVMTNCLCVIHIFFFLWQIKVVKRMSRRHAVTSWRRTVTSCDVMTSYRDVMTSYRDVTWRQVSWQIGSV